ncbi:hypothetical protein D3C72_1852010 [compost metagenome]
MVLKIPVAMPARSFGTTLTARPSIRPQGRLMPMPTMSNGKTSSSGRVPTENWLSQARPAADSSNPAPQMTAGANQRVNRPAAIGRMRSGAESAIIIRPAATSPIPSMPMNRTGSRMSSTTKPYAGAAASNCTPTKRGYRNSDRSSIGRTTERSIR